jgi:pyrimidine operon attenuation protein / uracil phosphoribosyltransferase
MSDERVPGERFCLYDTAALDAVLDRMAREIFPLLAGADDPLLLGILRRGAPLAEMLQARLEANHGLAVPRYAMKLKRYGDDLTLLHADTQLTENAEFAARDLSRATVLMVDDVLYQGHSLARLQAWLTGRGAPVVRAAVLVDRCCAVLPVKADIVGVRLQVAPTDVVECNVPPYEETFRIELLRPAR